MNDDHRRGLVMTSFSASNAPGEALVVGTRALEIARRLGDLILRIAATDYLVQAYYWRGDYEKVVELAADNLTTLPADLSGEFFGNVAPISVYERNWVVKGFALLGRFDEAATYAAEAIRLADVTHHTNTIANVHHALGLLHLLQGDWKKARMFFEHPIALYRAGNAVSVIRTTICTSSWILAQLGEQNEAESRLREGKQLIARYAVSAAVGYRGRAIHALGRTCLLLGRLDEARDLGARAIASVPDHHGFMAHSLHLLGDIATHPDRFDAERDEDYYRQSLALAEPRGTRPLVAHCHLGLGKLYRKTGKLEQSREHLDTATAMYGEMDMRFYIEQAGAERA